MTSALDRRLLSKLACPQEGGALTEQGRTLVCADGHEYPVYRGIPVLVRDDVQQTSGWAMASLERARRALESDAPEEQPSTSVPADTIDPHVQGIVASTCGHMYAPLVHKLTRYPIPDLRLPEGDGRSLLDIGCNWGRWSIAAVRCGYRPVGIDPSIDAVLAARRIAGQLAIEAEFVVADARYLPFQPGSFDTVFSYSVIQHFSKEDARRALDEAGRVLSAGGRSLIQMPNRFGLRSLYHQARRGFSEGKDFDVRYWTLAELRSTFQQAIGPSDLSVDGFFGLGIQKSDADLLPLPRRAVVHSSELLRGLSDHVGPLKHVADSVYIHSRKTGGPRTS